MSKYQQHSGVNTNFEQIQGMEALVKKPSLSRALLGNAEDSLLCLSRKRTLAMLPSHRPSSAAQPGGVVKGFVVPGEELCTSTQLSILVGE